MICLTDGKEMTMMTVFAKVFMVLFIVIGSLALIIASILYWCVFQAIREEKRRRRDVESNTISFDDTTYGKRAG
jgi:heme/copper-type cytochrome/quinol oxidase subunit 2